MDGRHAPNGRHSRGDPDRFRVLIRRGRTGPVVQVTVQEREERDPEDSSQLVQEQGDDDSGPSQARQRRVRRVAGLYRARVGREEELHAAVDCGCELHRRVLGSD